MKTFAVVLFFLLVGVGAQAQTDVAKSSVVLVETTDNYNGYDEEKKSKNEAQMARIYKHRISRIRKALSFTAKKSDAKVV